MTAKDRLHYVVDELTDIEAEVALRRIDALRHDPLVGFFDAAPVDDEEPTAEAEAGCEQDQSRISFDEIKRRHGSRLNGGEWSRRVTVALERAAGLRCDQQLDSRTDVDAGPAAVPGDHEIGTVRVGGGEDQRVGHLQ